MPFALVICRVDLMLKDFQIAADLTLRFGINCSDEVFCTVHRALSIGQDGVDIEVFLRFAYKFYLKYFGDKDKLHDAYSALKTKEQWDNAVLEELEKFIEGILNQCS